jgi:hypothetical protein
MQNFMKPAPQVGHSDSQIVAGCGLNQGCQMVYFQTKKPNLGKFGRVL